MFIKKICLFFGWFVRVWLQMNAKIKLMFTQLKMYGHNHWILYNACSVFKYCYFILGILVET